jgi:hypothetical protein
MNATTKDAREALEYLRDFIGPQQLAFIRHLYRGEEGQWFKDRMTEIAQQIEAMPKTYEQRNADAPIVAHLHYFIGRCDFYVAEKDIDDGEGQVQAWGTADIGYGPELGYISLKEITEAGAEIDLHFEPRPITDIYTQFKREDEDR